MTDDLRSMLEILRNRRVNTMNDSEYAYARGFLDCASMVLESLDHAIKSDSDGIVKIEVRVLANTIAEMKSACRVLK